MPSKKPSPNDHDRSEVWERPEVVAAIEQERARLGVRLRELRKRRDLSREAAAELIGIHWTSLQRVENGKTNVTLATLVAVAFAYKVPMSYLFPAVGAGQPVAPEQSSE